jgi:hypothetical protein
MQKCIGCDGNVYKNITDENFVCDSCGLICDLDEYVYDKHILDISIPSYIPKDLEFKIRKQASDIFMKKSEWHIKRCDPAMAMAAACIYCAALMNDILITKKDINSLNKTIQTKKITDEFKNLNTEYYELIDPFECAPSDKKMINTLMYKLKVRFPNLPDILSDCLVLHDKLCCVNFEQSRHAKTINAVIMLYFLRINDKYKFIMTEDEEDEMVEMLNVHINTLRDYTIGLKECLQAHADWGYNIEPLSHQN